MSEVFGVARGKVIDAKNGVALGQQAVGEVRSEKSGSAGNKCALRQIYAPGFSNRCRQWNCGLRPCSYYVIGRTQ